MLISKNLLMNIYNNANVVNPHVTPVSKNRADSTLNSSNVHRMKKQAKATREETVTQRYKINSLWDISINLLRKEILKI
jgi:flagellar biosynthesis component FlhA